MISLCDGWQFTEKWSEDFLAGKAEGRPVRLPHTVREIPLHCAGPEDYEMICGYRRPLEIPENLRGRRLFLQFDAAAHIAAVYVNGRELLTHRCGYTAFRAEITGLVEYGGGNSVAVKLDTTENGAVPPFGFVIDYLTFGGLYREVWLDVRSRDFIEDVCVTTPALDRAAVKLTVNGRPGRGGRARVRILDGEGRCLAEQTGMADFELRVPDARPWGPDDPALYVCEAALFDENGNEIDVQRRSFGFRTAVFKADGFYLNGKKFFLRGLNRHQSYPYVGYAAPEHLQREDARILKEELQCTAVRTSHYPQSQWFIDECDRLGLLVFTEIPGWQHIGDAAWKDQAVENVREMVLQYRNHPSIVLWGVRINESQDDDEFYRRTNALAHELDPSRQTSGVRYLEKSSLLEDVYAFNDFSHTGDNPGCKPKEKVTTDRTKGFLISECNGHMFPTKPFDTWERRQEHALRHARVQDAALADGEHAGCFGWCLFDYPTHKDFGSGDRVCYHGVTDFFRNPKLAAAVYASQGEAFPVLELGSSMDIGDYPGGQIGFPCLFTNADEVKLYKNGAYVTSYRPHGWKALPHGPIPVDDLIGELLESQEGFSPDKAALLRSCLLAARRYGLANMPLSEKARLGWAMLRCGIDYARGYELYGKYVGNWGGEATVWRFDAYRGGKLVLSRTCSPSRELHLELRPSKTALREGNSYDMAAVRIRVLDGYGNPAPYAQLPVKLRVEGAAELVGPDTVTAEGGMCGCYLRSVGRPGEALLHVSAGQAGEQTLRFSVEA
ncbi:MAG: glycoside hydrolase family 2 protein [Oscillospiraceae bacterium]|nr:glycoside hydrolase family 2 protein [Oscillospiraceae bacterium]